jgi:hypothetical protein
MSIMNFSPDHNVSVSISTTIIPHVSSLHKPQFLIHTLTEISVTNNNLNTTQQITKEEYIGSIKFKLYDDTAHFTLRNFQELASGINGFGYTGTTLH